MLYPNDSILVGVQFEFGFKQCISERNDNFSFEKLFGKEQGVRNSHRLFLIIDLAGGTNFPGNGFQTFFDIFPKTGMYYESNGINFFRANLCNIFYESMDDGLTSNR